MNYEFWAVPTGIALVLLLIGAGVAHVHVEKMRKREYNEKDEEVGAIFGIMEKMRKGQALTHEEVELADHVIHHRNRIPAFALPGTLFCLGSFYVLGSLFELHGRHASERTFLGGIAMFSAVNITIRLIRGAKLKHRLVAEVERLGLASAEHSHDPLVTDSGDLTEHHDDSRHAALSAERSNHGGEQAGTAHII